MHHTTEKTNGRLNGHVMPEKKLAIRRLEVLSIKTGQRVLVRVLSSETRGCMTHYYRGRSHACLGDSCLQAMHRMPTNWKGYCPIEMWIEELRVWRPYVLELTENLELDVRGIWQRGQTWEIWRDLPSEDKATPTQGRLWEENDPDTLPPAFDHVPVVQNLYHVIGLTCAKPNPMPPRIFVMESPGAPPAAIGGNTVPLDKQTEEEVEAIRRAWAKKKAGPKKGTDGRPAG